MKVIVCGAGQVGTSIVRRLAAENNDVTVIDRSPELVRHTVVPRGNALDPEILEEAATRW